VAVMMMMMVVMAVVVLWSREPGIGPQGRGRTHMRRRAISPGICRAVRCGICCCRCSVVCHFEVLVVDLAGVRVDIPHFLGLSSSAGRVRE
jgi:hypothetical protein